MALSRVSSPSSKTRIRALVFASSAIADRDSMATTGIALSKPTGMRDGPEGRHPNDTATRRVAARASMNAFNLTRAGAAAQAFC